MLTSVDWCVSSGDNLFGEFDGVKYMPRKSLELFLISLALFVACFPPYLSETYYRDAQKSMSPTSGTAVVFGGFHFWGYRSERSLKDAMASAESTASGWSASAYKHRVTWPPFVFIELIGLVALGNRVRSNMRQRTSTTEIVAT